MYPFDRGIFIADPRESLSSASIADGRGVTLVGQRRPLSFSAWSSMVGVLVMTRLRCAVLVFPCSWPLSPVRARLKEEDSEDDEDEDDGESDFEANSQSESEDDDDSDDSDEDDEDDEDDESEEVY